jgi:hypothetical protein
VAIAVEVSHRQPAHEFSHVEFASQGKSAITLTVYRCPRTARRQRLRHCLQIEEHLSRPELDDALNYGPNSAMIDRLRAGNTSTQDPMFCNHELYEKSLMDQGMGYKESTCTNVEVAGDTSLEAR